jgi:signal transduction histidine kinase
MTVHNVNKKRHGTTPGFDIYDFQEKLLTNSIHELRTPLTSLRGNLEVSLRRDRTPEEYKEVLTLSLRETDRIIDFLNNLKLLASSHCRLLDLFLEQVDLKMVVSERLRAYMPQIQARGIALELSELTEVICVCDENFMRQTTGNLLEKAVKYTPDGGKITIGASQIERNISLTIANTHRGMGKEKMRSLSRQRKKMSDIEGLGAGLSIARFIARSHQGDMQVRATDAVFSVAILLPVHQA